MTNTPNLFIVNFEPDGHDYTAWRGSVGYSAPKIAAPAVPYSGTALMSEKASNAVSLSYLNGNGQPPGATMIDYDGSMESGCNNLRKGLYDSVHDWYTGPITTYNSDCSMSPIVVEFPWDGADIASIAMLVDAVGSSCFSNRTNSIQIDSGAGLQTVGSWGDCGNTLLTRTATGPFYNVSRIRLTAHRRRDLTIAYTRLKSITIAGVYGSEGGKVMEVSTAYATGVLQGVSARFMVEYTDPGHADEQVTFKLEAGNTQQTFTLADLPSGRWVTLEWSGSVAASSATRVSVFHNGSGGPTGIKFYIDQIKVQVAYATPLGVASEASINTAEANCPIVVGGQPVTGQPVTILNGEKQETVTDLRLNSPAESLAFTRFYRQSKHGAFQSMGLGWTHSHLISLTPPSGGEIGVQLANGGEGRFKAVSATSYVGVKGVNASIAIDAGSTTARYTLTASDQSVYIFDSDGKLRSRSWPNGETWTYTYYTSGVAIDKLQEVADGYGRKLQLTYVNNPGQYDHRQLWRVGDQNAVGLDGASPTGNYVQFTYVPEKNDGIPSSNPKALLSAVRDVRGFVWDYDYYGQHSGETAAAQLNFLTKVVSPSVDTTGDGTPDGALTLKALAYTLSGSTITQLTEQLGQQGSGPYLLETSLVFQPGGQAITEETTAGKTLTHHFLNDVYLGVENPAGEQSTQYTNADYRPFIQQDGNGQCTYLTWANQGRQLRMVTDPLGRDTVFDYDGQNRLVASIDAARRKTLYMYEDSDQPRQPSLILVTDGRSLIANGGMEVEADWTKVSTPTSQRIPKADGGQYTRHVVAAAAGEGIEGSTWDLQAGYSYTITARVYLVSGAVQMHVSGETAFDRTSSKTGVWETLSATYTPGSSAAGKKLQFIAVGQAAEFYVDSVSIQQDGSELAVNGGMEADSDWTAVGSPALNERTLGADTGHYAYRVIADAAGEGIEGAAWNLVADRCYVILARVYPVSGTVKMKVTGTAAFDQPTSGTAAWETLRSVYTPGTNANGVKLQFLAEGGAAEFYVDTVHVLDSTMLLQWQEFSYDSQGRSLTEKRIDPADGSTVQQQITRSYYTSGSGNGLLQTLTQEDIGGTNDVTTTYSYDSAGRVTKTQRSSAFGSCDISYTVYDTAGNVVATLCNYDPGTNPDPTTAAEAAALYNATYPDQNRVTTYEYDTLGRRVKTTLNDGAAFKQTNLTFYDALNRVSRTITHYVAQGSSAPGNWVYENGQWKQSAGGTAISHSTDNTQNIIADTIYNARGMVRLQRDPLGNVTLLGYDDAGRLVKTIQRASQPAYNNDYAGTSPDPTLGSYSPNSAVDQDIITTHQYDAAGNRVKTIDPLGAISYTVYDALNRPVKTVRAANDAATLALNPGDSGYNAAHDPRSASYAPSTSPDRDLIETTEYDALGRVMRTQRLLENRPTAVWETTLYGYDPLGRQVKVIRSASQPTYNLTADPDLSAYVPGSSADQDIISQTVYDDHGRVLYGEDPLAARHWIGYDGLGRQVKAIANAVGTATDGGANDPRSGSYTPSSDADKDLITRTVYDSSGRVQSTQDALSRVTHNVYDGLGRVIRTIAHYVQQGTSDPANWAWSATNNRWEYSAGNAVDHGTDHDQNLIAETVYDAQGRVSRTLDHRHNETRSVYDALGRRVKTISNYVVQGSSDPANWLWDAVQNRWEDGSNNAISLGADNDQNRITATTYDLAGRVTATRDAAGIEARYAYDALGRRTTTIANYVDGVYSGATPDEDLISTTAYNKGGQVVSATDTRGTQTAFTYDQVGRRLTVTQAASSPLASVAYTCYDKAGRVLRTLANWTNDPTQPAPDSQDGSGNWSFVPAHNGPYRDRDLITLYEYDLASRRTKVTDPVGSFTTTAYFKDGQVQAITDPEGMVTQFRYDGLRRRRRVVQGYASNGEDPALWVWDAGQGRWEQSGGSAIDHTSNNDRNIIVDVTYDKGGRVLSLREPRGNLTTYTYDGRDRRKTLTNPLSKTWQTAYSDLFSAGGTRATLTDPNGVNTQRDFDRLGRLASITYGDPASTPDVKFAYDAAGNRARMSEYSGAGFTNRSRETTYGYDDVRRLTSVGFDNDGSGTVDETVSYEYDAGGLRTRLTLPGSLSITYTYDVRGQLVSLTDWDNQQTQYAYDLAGRLMTAARANGLHSRYDFDAGGRLRRLRHTTGFRTLAHFTYEVDKRGHRTQALECLAHPATTSDTTIPYNDKGIIYKGAWSDSAPFKVTSQFSDTMMVMFLGDNVSFTYGTGPDQSIFDVYVGGSLWQSFDGYAASPGEISVTIPLNGEGPHLFEIRNRPEKNNAATGFKVRFKQLVVTDKTYDLHTIEYTYDALSRVREGRYNPNINTAAADADLLRRYQYAFDVAGNRTQQIVTVAGTPTTTNYTYNAANQLTSGGATYDHNGNMTFDGGNSYSWDRVNRLLSMGGVSSKYDGEGRRIQKTVGVDMTKYLLDLQPGLPLIVAQTIGANTTRFVHSLMGIHAQENPSGVWTWAGQDALSSVRLEANNVLAVNGMHHLDPFGNPFETQGTMTLPFVFTGEIRDESGLQDHRGRQYSSQLGIFPSLDLLEGIPDQPMSLNGYSYANGNPVNLTDASGMCAQPTQWWNPVDANCYYSAVGLAQRFSKGNANAYNQWFNVLIQKPWHELKVIEGLGTLNDATILPQLVLHEDPSLVIEAFKQFSQQLLCDVGSSASLAFLAVRSGNIGILGGSATGTGVGLKGLIPGIAVGVGIGIGLSALLGLNAFIRMLTDEAKDDDENDCIDPETGESWKKDIFIVDPTPNLTLAHHSLALYSMFPRVGEAWSLNKLASVQPTIIKDRVECIASGMRKGKILPKLDSPRGPISFQTFDDGRLTLSQGNHRFMASVVTGIYLFGHDFTGFSGRGIPFDRVQWV